MGKGVDNSLLRLLGNSFVFQCFVLYNFEKIVYGMLDMSKNCVLVELDGVDCVMFCLLQEDGVLLNVMFGEKLLLSVMLCWCCCKWFEDEYVIIGYQVNFDWCMFGMNVFVFVQVMFNMYLGQDLDYFEDVMWCYDEVMLCYKIIGVVDYILQVVVVDFDVYVEFVECVLWKQVGVLLIQLSFVLCEVKFLLCVLVLDV